MKVDIFNESLKYSLFKYVMVFLLETIPIFRRFFAWKSIIGSLYCSGSLVEREHDINDLLSSPRKIIDECSRASYSMNEILHTLSTLIVQNALFKYRQAEVWRHLPSIEPTHMSRLKIRTPRGKREHQLIEGTGWWNRVASVWERGFSTINRYSDF